MKRILKYLNGRYRVHRAIGRHINDLTLGYAKKSHLDKLINLL